MQEQELKRIVNDYLRPDYRAARFLGDETEQETSNAFFKFQKVLERLEGSRHTKGVPVSSITSSTVECRRICSFFLFFVVDYVNQRKDLETFLSQSGDQLKSGDPTIVRLLSVVTEEWLYQLEKMAGIQRINSREIRLPLTDTVIIFDISQATTSESSRNVYPNNVDLINVSR